jgi:hypothetical protein
MAKQREIQKPTLALIASQNPGFVAVPEDVTNATVTELVVMGYRVMVVHEIAEAHYRMSEHFISSMAKSNPVANTRTVQ